MKITSPAKKARALRPKRFSVYVVELDPCVMDDRRFRERNPQHLAGRPCVYVGMTALTPEERFAKHLSGWKANRYVKRHGQWLRRRLYSRLNPMTYEAALAEERALAARLRKRGFAVWQN